MEEDLTFAHDLLAYRIEWRPFACLSGHTTSIRHNCRRPRLNVQRCFICDQPTENPRKPKCDAYCTEEGFSENSLYSIPSSQARIDGTLWSRYTLRTFAACSPFGPRVTSNST